MKTTEIEHVPQIIEPDAPFPTQPPTEEVIIPSINRIEGAPKYEQGEIAVRKDDAYPLAHRMIFDLFTHQAKLSVTHSREDFDTAMRMQAHIVKHVQEEIYRGYLFDQPLQFSDNPLEDIFTHEIATRYVIDEISKMRQQGPDPEVIPPLYVEQSLFDSVDDARFNEPLNTQAQVSVEVTSPDHIEEVLVEDLNIGELTTLQRFNEIAQRLGSGVVGLLGVSVRSKEVPIIGPNGTIVMNVVSEDTTVRSN